MGSILEAQDCKIGRTVAVKIILSEINADETQKQRFINEAAVRESWLTPTLSRFMTSGGTMKASSTI